MNFTRNDAAQIIVDADVKHLVEAAESIGEALAKQLTTSQIRNIFGEVRRIEMLWPTELAEAEQHKAQDAFRQTVLLRPKIAYQAKREKGRGVEELQSVLDPCLQLIQDASQAQRKPYFQRFLDFFEAILAYHKAAGGK